MSSERRSDFISHGLKIEGYQKINKISSRTETRFDPGFMNREESITILETYRI